MSLLRLLVLCLLLALGACASQPRIEEDPTIQLLEQRAAHIEPAALPPLPRRDVRRSYEELATSTANEGLKVIALERIADLELEKKQAAQAGERGAVAAEEENVHSAIHQYERLLELYPDYAGNDRVMYQLARAYELNGELDKTLAVLTKLIARYPQLPNRDELQFRRGEILFAFREFEQAEQAYHDIVAKGPSSAYYDRALFKQGWSVFKQGQTQRSLQSYFGVLDRSFANHRDIADFDRSELEVLDDTLRIISLSLSYLKGPDTLAAFFDSYGTRDYAFRVYERLGDLYLTQKRPDDAAETFLRFVQRHPQHRQSPLFMVRVIDIYKQGGRLPELLRAKADLVTYYGVGTSFWKQHDAQLLTQVKPHLEANLDDLARYYHAQAQKSKKATDYRLAAHWYRTYVRSFPDNPKTPHMNMLLAETLLDSGDVAGAGQEFAHTAYGYPPHADSAEAGYAALLAVRRQIAPLQGEARVRQRREAIASAKRFVASFPADQRAVPAMSKAAEALYDLHDYGQAVATAHYVVGALPKPEAKLLRINWAIIADGEFALGQYADAEQAAAQRLRLAQADDKERKNFEERLAAAIYKQGEQARAAGDHAGAAQHFLRVATLVPTASIRPNAEYDAAAELFSTQNWAAAIPVLKAFIQRYPGNELRKGADEKLALAYEKSGDWKHAADAYQVLYRDETNGERKRLLLWQTAQFYEKAQRPDDALEIYKRYVRDFPQPFDEAIEARLRLADIYKQQKQLQARHYWLGKIIEADKQGPGTERSHYLAALASMELALPKYESYRKVHLVRPLKENLKKKKRLLQESVSAYTAAANYGVEAVTTASTYRIAEIYNEFSRSLYASERPKGLSSEELQQYDILLEEQAYPFEEKAIKVHVVNAQRAVSGVYDKWVQQSFAALAKLDPARYAKEEKGEGYVSGIE
jgi:outer membrane protein assembly factor BamD (BamD/ComL family)